MRHNLQAVREIKQPTVRAGPQLMEQLISPINRIQVAMEEYKKQTAYIPQFRTPPNMPHKTWITAIA